eukprot:TRINITY_DN60190_c0_g1_i1.p1 TRINITY_DN60190_c0_g1~~TRINITY_DN60190_c0_g1_i1.p1  ORF type:complete len:474 (+),score=156.17 TRINITY_DN60190_c0_g1_i1:66-1487(+)
MVRRGIAVALLAAAGCAAGAPSVAVVGSGVAGSSAAYFLHDLAPDVDITVFEAGPEVGGRTSTLQDYGVPVDWGATAISSLNDYLVSFIEKFNMTKQDSANGKDVIGLWDGQAFRFLWPDGAALPERIVARYGLTPLKAVEAVRGAVNKLKAVYGLQANGTSFDSPAALFDRLGLTPQTQQSAYDMFKQLGVADKFVYEFVDAMSRDNYGQDSVINGFVDLVSLAGAGIDGNVFSLAKGTQQIPKALLGSIGPQVSVRTASTVKSVEAVGSQFRLLHAPTGSASAPTASTFDAVVIATPLETSRGLELVRPAVAVNRTRPYQRTCVCFVSGTVNPAYFGLPPGTAAPTELITVENASLPFTTLAQHAVMANGTGVYKLFSRSPLSEGVLDAVFSERHMTRFHTWDAAYPQLEPTPPSTWPRFAIPLRTADGGSRDVLYTNAMESPVSCMETEIIAAKNAALRVRDMLQRPWTY